ncbi:putative NET domain-containing protein [Dioscorea sansibarensis]
MFKDSRENECGPDYFGYWKHLFLDLLSPSGGALLPLKESDTEPAAGTCSVGGNGSVSYFSEALSKGLSELKKEKVNLIMKQSIIRLNNEADEMLDNILAAFQLEADLRGKELLCCYSSASDEDLSVHSGHRKRKASSSPMSSCPDNHTSQTAKQVHGAIQALQGNGEIGHEAVEKYLNEMLTKLGKMEVDLEDFLNVLVSKCRPMTSAEKRRLGRLIRKLPCKAIDRLAEIIKDRNPATNHDTIQVDFEELDNVTLWRLYFYVETVARANHLCL